MVSEGIQDAFLSILKEQRKPVYIFLANGIKLTGVITAFDCYCIQLTHNDMSQTVYKHAISTVMVDHAKTASSPLPGLDNTKNNEPIT